jgi:hypothetical protein
MIDKNSTESEIEAVVALFGILFFNIGAATLVEFEKGVRWTPLVGRAMGLNKVVGLAARRTPIGPARPLQRFNFLMC